MHVPLWRLDLPPRRRGRRRSESAQAIVETALLLPYLIVILTMGYFIGEMTRSAIDASTAARAGAIGASYQFWKGSSQTTQAATAGPLACNEQTGNGTSCTASCSSSTCTFTGTTALVSLKVNDIKDANNNNYAEVRVAELVTPAFSLIGSYTVTAQVTAMAEQ